MTSILAGSEKPKWRVRAAKQASSMFERSAVKKHQNEQDSIDIVSLGKVEWQDR